MSPTNTCAGCQNPIPRKNEYLLCCICKLKYDVDCANVGHRRFTLMDTLHKNSWKCPECRSKVPKIGNTNTPVRGSQPADEEVELPVKISPEHSNVTLRSKQNQSSKKKQEVQDCLSEDKLREIIKHELTVTLQCTIKKLVTAELRNINEQISGFRESMTFFNTQFEEMRSSLEEKSLAIVELKSDNEKLKTSVADLSNRLNTVELHMRESNIEINGIPEHRSENLIDTVIKLTKVVDNPLSADDIKYVTRVAKLHKDATRPRAVIAKLSNSRQRDAVLAAVSKFNKKNTKEKLGSDHLGIGGQRNPVFVSEHLTPGNKSLHAATRMKAKEMSYKFVWVRNGRIYVRKDENNQSILIRSPNSLKLMS